MQKRYNEAMQLPGVTTVCFAASYALALGLELVQVLWPRQALRLIALLCGGAGLLAQTLFLLVQVPRLGLESPAGSILLIAWILAIFYLYGAIHHRQFAWAIFVLPLVLGLIGVATLAPVDDPSDTTWGDLLTNLRGEKFWGLIHGGLLLLSAVGVCVGFVASVMYLWQAHRLKAKVPPRQGIQLLSLERLEAMNRRAIVLAFPLLTAGVFLGAILLVQRSAQLRGWTDPRIMGACLLWLVFAILLYLRYGYHLRGRRIAQWTIAAFLLLLVTLASTHTTVQGGSP
ncbi:MAG: cytochrome c biogenesis protein [Gemmataceae bacterium]|nr:cytochrome c biogenesis protein [Gemmataceae bacterium]MDW8265639.1 cytochrome c biogenesis protein CcsA [Gemmataceae bacterium]